VNARSAPAPTQQAIQTHGRTRDFEGGFSLPVISR
jgi:hypothetical protein